MSERERFIYVRQRRPQQRRQHWQRLRPRQRSDSASAPVIKYFAKEPFCSRCHFEWLRELSEWEQRIGAWLELTGLSCRPELAELQTVVSLQKKILWCTSSYFRLFSSQIYFGWYIWFHFFIRFLRNLFHSFWFIKYNFLQGSILSFFLLSALFSFSKIETI